MATHAELYGTPTVPELNGHAKANVLHISGTGTSLLVPLMLMKTVDPEVVSVALPYTWQLLDRLIPFQVPPVTVSVAVEAVAVNVIVPGMVTGEPLPQVTVRL
ncbi:hypothetical protein SBA3_1090026 [Candidatus Sulfopaludibacter sp. SbA3]|nr:hypothetical protein SBA3_1090026 [Candidatus Sulfopaludibacter sp. SbA3]